MIARSIRDIEQEEIHVSEMGSNAPYQWHLRVFGEIVCAGLTEESARSVGRKMRFWLGAILEEQRKIGREEAIAELRRVAESTGKFQEMGC